MLATIAARDQRLNSRPTVAVQNPNTGHNRSRTVYVDLRSPHEFFTTGDEVCGHVRVHPTERPNGITIAFSGQCKMTIVTGGSQKTTSKIHRSTLELFSASRSLFDSQTSGESYEIINKGLGADGNVELPFKFTFPDVVKMKPSDTYKPRYGFEHEAGHQLPPSCLYDENKVEYLLEVHIYKTANRSLCEIIQLALPFRPTASSRPSPTTINLPNNSEICMRGHHLNPKNEQNPGVLTKLKWSTLSKYQHAIPEARWRIAAKCPFRLVAGKVVPISFSVSHLGHTPDIPETPIVYARQVRVKLTSILTVRIPYQGITGTRDTIREHEKVITDKVFVVGEQVLRDGLRMDEIGKLKLPPTILPSFKTYGLRLSYRIKIVVQGNCALESFSVTTLRDLCEIVCDVQRQERNAPMTVTAGASSSTPLQHQQVIDGQLPAYDPAPRYTREVSSVCAQMPSGP
ncbi:hypothetical protein C7974DRAFT_413716 [Boeremia exigua]|uniref:uncharacterized protein n=1 Tax=Boeremia exigua TaxID=749465 RepID=UPI001E8DDA6E|nr:uncharacterized protein C7974DRAFT_413716 [Boeremia exigua]KAH6625184.1 hypothetical protein C7974DRAFT_413716 [Boeremia exigua]